MCLIRNLLLPFLMLYTGHNKLQTSTLKFVLEALYWGTLVLFASLERAIKRSDFCRREPSIFAMYSAAELVQVLKINAVLGGLAFSSTGATFFET